MVLTIILCGKATVGSHFQSIYLSDFGDGFTRTTVCYILLCRILRRQDRPVPHPRHGNMQVPGGKPAARYRQMAAAVDGAAQTILTVSPFDPAVRDDAIAPLRFGRCQCRSTAWIPARTRDLIFDGRSIARSQHQRAGSLRVHSNTAAELYLHTDCKQDWFCCLTRCSEVEPQPAHHPKRRLQLIFCYVVDTL